MPYEDRHGRTCGFVDFEIEESSGRFFRRYFIISPQDGCFYCYMDNPTNLPDGSKPVSDIKLSHISNARDATKQRPKVDFCFVVTTPDRSYYFQADNQGDLEEWVRSLNGASRIMFTANSGVAGGGRVVLQYPSVKFEPLLKIPDKKSEIDADHAENGGSKDKHNTISYRTEIVGGVVVRTPVERDGHPTSLPRKQLRCYPPSNTRALTPNLPSDSDSDDEASIKSRSWPRSPSPTPPLNRPNLNTLPHQHQAVKTGWCVKQGGVRRNWKRRFFVLNDKGLSYFKSETDKEPLRTIAKKDMTTCRESHNSQLLAQRDNLLEVATGQRTFYLQAYSPEEMEDWIKAIQTVISSQRASSPEQSASKRGSLQHEKPENKRDSRKSLSDKHKRDSNRLRVEPVATACGTSKESARRSQWYDEDVEIDRGTEHGVKAETDVKQKTGGDCVTGAPQQEEKERVSVINTSTMVTEL